jgi:hypothetical protein
MFGVNEYDEDGFLIEDAPAVKPNKPTTQISPLRQPDPSTKSPSLVERLAARRTARAGPNSSSLSFGETSSAKPPLIPQKDSLASTWSAGDLALNPFDDASEASEDATNPFADSVHPVDDSSNPFADNTSSNADASNPFADNTSSNADASNPFAAEDASDEEDASNPFAGSSDPGMPRGPSNPLMEEPAASTSARTASGHRNHVSPEGGRAPEDNSNPFQDKQQFQRSTSESLQRAAPVQSAQVGITSM